MIVVLQNHLTTKAEGLPVKPSEESFVEALVGMGVGRDIIEYMVIIIEVRGMIMQGLYGGRNKNVFRIIIDDHISFSDRSELNKTIAHELKHLATAILMPHSPEDSRCIEGFYFGKRPYKWEEINCGRAEKKWGGLEYFERV